MLPENNINGYFFWNFERNSTQTENNSNIQEPTEVKKISSECKSSLRPNEKLNLGKIYTDIVKYVKFDDNGDNWLVVVKKNKDTVGLICDKEQSDFLGGEEIEIQWKMDSIRYAGDPEFLNYHEFLISAKKINSNFSVRDFSRMKNQSFVISCGTGCAMTHNVKKINQINPSSIEVTFEIEMYINEELTETFDETYTFKYKDSNVLEKITREGETENAMETFVGSAKKSFQDFGTKLIN